MLTHSSPRPGTLAVMFADKPSARAALLSLRRAIPPDTRAAADRRLLDHLVSRLPPTSRIAAFVPVHGEPGGSALPETLRTQGFAVLLPILRPDLDLEWAAFDGRLTDGPYGLRHPTGTSLGTEAIRAVDVVIVPAVAVDRRGVRLGRGGGSYDRALARASDATVTVAPLYPAEWVDELPCEPHDQVVRAIVTPDGWIDLPAQPIATPS
jgi:5-formyltetrahydrofolate cyclo-ligase